MRKVLQVLGIIMILEGVSGAIDQVAVQPFFGLVLNAFNRFVVNRLDFLNGYEVFVNLTVAVLGVALVVAADRAKRA